MSVPLSDADRLPLSALLSHALVAFTIELDNAFESRMPHRTTDHGGTAGAPWATSLRQWSNVLRLVPEDGITAGALAHEARAAPQLDAMRRWGYIRVEAAEGDTRAKPPDAELVLRLKRGGRRARAVWAPLPAEIEQRWRERFGAELMDELGEILTRIGTEIGAGLPQWITFTYGRFAHEPVGDGPAFTTPFSALLSQPLQVFALAYEQGVKVSLCDAANVLRVLDHDGVRVTDLPQRSGIASPAMATALGQLAKRGIVEELARDRRRIACLTDSGARAKARYPRRTAEIEAEWGERFGAETIARLRDGLERLALPSPSGEPPPLLAGLTPPPGTWRSKIRALPVLPEFPMPRQGGHPDGT